MAHVYHQRTPEQIALVPTGVDAQITRLEDRVKQLEYMEYRIAKLESSINV